MIIIHRKSTNPYFNLAAEEYLVKHINEPCFMLWQNSPSVIIGKHQNPLKEVNLEFCKNNDIPIIRRISGGGTVYHDLGNINYSFIDFGKQESLVNFTKYSQPILDVLNDMGVKAELVGKSDLKINGSKFSGNASHVHRNKVLHHGTLLFQSELNILNESIQITKGNITDKSVNSNRSQVCNISEHLKQTMSIEDFKSLLLNHIKKQFPEAKEVDFSEVQGNEIKKLVNEKYLSWEWNFGYSPRYFINSKVEINGEIQEFKTEVYKGFIQNINCSSPISKEIQENISAIIGKQHEEKIIRNLLNNSTFTNTLIEILF